MGAGPSTNLNATTGGQTTGYTCSVDNNGNINCRRLSEPVAGAMLYTCSNSGSGQYPIVCSDGSATTYACSSGSNPTCVVERDLLAPTIQVAPVSGGGYRISWQSQPSQFGTSYEIYRGDQPDPISRGTSTKAQTISYTDATATSPQQNYLYWVQVSNGAQTVQSNRVSVLAPAGGPLNPTLEAIAPGQVRLSWNRLPGRGTYTLTRTPAGSSASPTVLASGSNSTSFVDTTLVPGMAYVYGMSYSGTNPATTASVNFSDPSGSGGSTPSPTPPAPSGGGLKPPLIIQPPALSGTTLTLTWNDVNARSYTIVRSASGESPKTFSATGTTYSDRGINPSKAYTYTVTGTNGGQSTSAMTSYTPTAATALTPTAQTTGGITTLSWNNVGGSQYLVSRSPTGQNQQTQLGSTSQTFFHDRTAQAGSTYDYVVATTVNGAALQGTLTYTVPAVLAPITPTGYNWWWIGGGLLFLLIIIIVIIIIVVLARRKPEEELVEVEFEEV